MKWLMSVNENKFKYKEAFEKNPFIDLIQTVNYDIGDIVYIYSPKPQARISHKCKVVRVNLDFRDTFDYREFLIDEYDYYDDEEKGKVYFSVELLEIVDNDELKIEFLNNNGLKTSPHRPMKLHGEILEYIEKYFEDDPPDDYDDHIEILDL
jgi:5-methylcytosine-specific restriction protein A